MAKLERSKGKRSLRKPTWLILVEGEKREYGYLKVAKIESPIARTHALNVESLNGGGVADNIARACDEIEDRDADRIYLVLDTDLMPPNVMGKNAEAINLQLERVNAINTTPSNPKIILIRSNPCVEAWFVLHFQDNVPAHPNCGPLKALVKRHCPSLDKRPEEDWRKLDEHRKAAKRRAKRIRQMGGTNATLTVCGSEMDLLLDDLGL